MRKFILLMMVAAGLMKTDCRSSHGSADHKILGGTPVTDMRQVPYIVSLLIHGFDYGSCGGTIITPLWVVTACHCVAEEDNKEKGVLVSMTKRIPLDRWTWIAGTDNLNNVDHAHVQYGKPVIVIHHPECKISVVHDGFTYNDMGLVKMKKPFKITEYVKPAKLFSLNKRQFETRLRRFIEKPRPEAQSPKCIVAGWGKYQADNLAELFWGTPSPVTTIPPPIEDRDQLKSSVQQLLPAESCMVVMEQAIKNEVPGWFRGPEDVRNWREVTRKKIKNQICILSEFKNESACQGDSGGGVVCDEFLVGIISWGYGCVGSTPTILLNLVNVFDWFKNNICNISNCEDVNNRQSNCVVPRRLEVECRNQVPTFMPPPKGLSSAESALRNISNVWLVITLAVIAQNTLFHTYRRLGFDESVGVQQV